MHGTCAHSLIAAVVKGLGLQHEHLRSNAARTYFRNGQGRASSRKRVLRAFHESLTDFSQRFQTSNPEGRAWVTRVDRDSLVQQVVDAWDWNVHQTDGIALAILDLSVRLYGAALLCLSDNDAVCSTIGALASDSPLDWCSASDHPTQERFAELADVSARQVQRWFDGSASPSEWRLRWISAALSRTAENVTVPKDIEARLSRWFAARRLKRALKARVGAELCQRLATAVPLLLRTLASGFVIHPADVEAARVGPDGGPFALLVYGTNTMSLDRILDAIHQHVRDPEWSSFAGTLLTRLRDESKTPVRSHVSRPRAGWGPWDEPGFLESSRPLPIYPQLAATYADIARKRGRRRPARRLAKEAASRGEPSALIALDDSKRRRQTRRKV